MPYFQDAHGGLHYLSAIDVEDDGEALLPAGCTEISDAAAAAIQNPSLTLEQERTAQIDGISAVYAAAVTLPVSFKTAAGVTQTFQADTDSQTILMQATQGYVLAGSVPSDFYWVAADNTQVAFTLADLQGLYQAMLARGWAAFQQLQARKAQINAASTVEAVQAITW